MVFSSALFLTMFFPLVLGFYFLAQERLRNYVLLAASLLFYAWGEPKAVFVMIALIAVSYIAALAIEKYPRYAKMFLVAGIALNLSALLFYKYWMFLLEMLIYCRVGWHLSRLTYQKSRCLSVFRFTSFRFCPT